jgi:arylsulfatase A-like enzyme
LAYPDAAEHNTIMAQDLSLQRRAQASARRQSPLQRASRHARRRQALLIRTYPPKKSATLRKDPGLSRNSGMPRYTRRELLQAGLRAAPLAAALHPAAAQRRRPTGPRFNVLFLAVDDLRPDLGCYGHPLVRTPHIDQLAAAGLTFTRSYCQQAAGNPSRTSLLTGRRPDTTGVFDLETHFRRRLPDAATLPQHYKKYGYETTAFGKIVQKPALDDLPSWSIAPWVSGRHPWRSAENQAYAERRWQQLQQQDWVSTDDAGFDPSQHRAAPPHAASTQRDLPSWDSPNVADNALPDGQAAEAAVAALGELRAQRFFLAVGFLRPRLPFIAPKRYFDLYPPEAIALAKNPEPPFDVPQYALIDSTDLRQYSDIPRQGPIPEAKARELVRAYYAGISYVDAQVGRLLAALDQLHLRESTIVVLWGDHGYHLGDHGLWSEMTNFEAATHAPLLISVPGQQSAGRKTAALTESVDLYPALCEICQLPAPLGLEGSSFVPLFADPDRLWKRAVFSQSPREIPGVGSGMGYSMRTARYRYTEWTAADNPFRAAELYDYQTDPLEQRNVANRPENISLVNGLSGMLREGWRASLPPTDIRPPEKTGS